VFTYQGLLRDGSGPVNATCDLQFKLWDASSGGAQVGGTVLLEDMLLADGLFTARLDFGAAAFRGQARYLEVAASCPVESEFVALPRQELTGSPYALWAMGAPWTGLTGVPVDLADGDQDTTYSAGTGLSLVGGQFSVNFAGTGSAATASRSDHNHDAAYVNEGQVNSVSTGMVQNSTLLLEDLNQNGCSAGQVIKWNGSAWACAADQTATGSYWSLTGNAGTTPGTNYLGTSDNVALELRVNGARALRLEPNATSPNLIGGYSGNSVTDGVYGATIGGGGNAASTCGAGDEPCWNSISGGYGTVGGGYSNTVSGLNATVGGGYRNTASGLSATVGGGSGNTTSAGNATVGGGIGNTAGGLGTTVGGGGGNTASGDYATVPGGYSNEAAGDYSFAAGRWAHADHDGAFVWADSTLADFASTAPDQFLVRARGGVMMVVGSGGWRIQPDATSPNLIGGYSGNWLTAEVHGATIGGGGSSSYPNRVTDFYGTVGGGLNNQAGDNAYTLDSAVYATVGGGQDNTASSLWATVSGGVSNTASGYHDTVGGGGGNTAGPAEYATVGGGLANTADGYAGAVGGGVANTASGGRATAPGGELNTAAGQYSFAAGRRAKALHDGAFVWADSTDADFASTAANQFSVRAGGGVTMAVGSGWWRIQPDATSPNLIAGNSANTVAAGLYGATIAGGGSAGSDCGVGEERHCWNLVNESYATIGGGESNEVSGYASTVGGGVENTASGPYATVGGGSTNSASGDTAMVGGGWQNGARALYATVGGGAGNEASGSYAAVAGGNGNTAEGDWDTVAGGNGNQASGGYATIGGGRVNLASGYHATVGGGESNEATGSRSAVGGGLDNVASGAYAAVAGGSNNTAQGNYSFAAGNRAKANNQGCFVWGDSYAGDVTCSNDNRTIFRSTGGFYIYTNTGLSTGAYIAAGSNSWSGVSDRATKENFSSVDAQALLATLAALPIQEYNLKSQDPSVRHIGPVAQDFAAFGYGESDRAINMQDADGVALAAIQGLYAENQALQNQIVDLEARLAALEGGQRAGGSTARLPGGWLLLGGGVVAAGVVAGRRAWGGGR